MTLPYAVMCELKALAGEYPSTNFIRIGSKRPDPRAMAMPRYHPRPMSAVRHASYGDIASYDRREEAASTQDLVDLGLIKHGFLVEGEIQTKHYGFHLTEKAIEMLKAEKEQAK